MGEALCGGPPAWRGRDPTPYLNAATPSLPCGLESKHNQEREGRTAKIHSDLQEEEYLRAELHSEHRRKGVKHAASSGGGTGRCQSPGHVVGRGRLGTAIWP